MARPGIKLGLSGLPNRTNSKSSNWLLAGVHHVLIVIDGKKVEYYYGKKKATWINRFGGLDHTLSDNYMITYHYSFQISSLFEFRIRIQTPRFRYYWHEKSGMAKMNYITDRFISVGRAKYYSPFVIITTLGPITKVSRINMPPLDYQETFNYCLSLVQM